MSRAASPGPHGAGRDQPRRDRFRIGPVGAFPPGRGLAVEAAGRDLAVFNLDGELVALDGRCLHRRGPLAEGFVRDGVVTCPMHWWRYEIRSGRCLSAPGSLERHPIVIEDGEVSVEVEPLERDRRDGGDETGSIRERLLRLGRAWTAARDRIGDS